MKVALVHDYIKEFGGAERVLKVLTEIFPEAPIYTAFCVKGSTAYQEFKNKKIIESFLAPILKLGKLYSPLRFLIPVIWGGFDLSDYDLVITSCSWYVTRGFKIGPETEVVAYCHTPPRWLYGYETSVGFTKYWPVKVYATIVGHFIRLYDFLTAQPPERDKNPIRAGVNLFIANSENVRQRIQKFYKREAIVIYPPVEVEEIKRVAQAVGVPRVTKAARGSRVTGDYFLIVSRLVGAKGIEEAASAFKNLPYRLKIVGEAAGYSDVSKKLKKLSGGNVELLGRVSDNILYELYAKAKGFIALARDEDFGITPVEAQAAGTPVIAYNGGGFKETVIDGVTGILINSTDERTIRNAISRFNKIKWNKNKIQENAERFAKSLFVRRMEEEITNTLRRRKDTKILRWRR